MYFTILNHASERMQVQMQGCTQMHISFAKEGENGEVAAGSLWLMDDRDGCITESIYSWLSCGRGRTAYKSNK